MDGVVRAGGRGEVEAPNTWGPVDVAAATADGATMAIISLLPPPYKKRSSTLRSPRSLIKPKPRETRREIISEQ